MKHSHYIQHNDAACASPRRDRRRASLTGLLLTVTAALAASAALPTVVRAQEAPPVLHLAQNQRPQVSLDAAVAKVRSRYPGQVVRAETRYGRDGVPVHHIRVLTEDGRLRTIRVDGRTGRIL